MQIGIPELIACGVQPTQARIYGPLMGDALAVFEITTRARVAAFLAQVATESANFTRTEESLFYKTPERIRAMWPQRVPSYELAAQLCGKPRELANTVYSNRLGNGDASSDDGWRYRGRGLIQLTGRSNYKVAGDALRVDYLTQPELVAEPADALMTAGWFWSSIQANVLADASLIDAITRKVNGPGMVAADERRSRFEHNLQVL